MNEFIRALADCPTKIIGLVIGRIPDKPACRVKFTSDAEMKASANWIKARFCERANAEPGMVQMTELPDATLEVKVP